eukprot:m.10877 g.10877  ORF g.10877 m.10877 type:complete len:84 (-) comp2567_c0_seq1:277-528(-)
MAAILAGAAVGAAVTKKAIIAGGLSGVAGIFGMIGWAIWLGGVQKDDAYSSLNLDIGYSQAIAIAAWCTALVVAGPAFLLRSV